MKHVESIEARYLECIKVRLYDSRVPADPDLRQTTKVPSILHFFDKTPSRGKLIHAKLEDFKTILATLGGEGERSRAAQLVARVTVVDDQESLRSSQLEHSGKINDRSRTIFGTGDVLKVVTVTANTGFIR